MVAGPLIGALIGYCTNYIAVKMLFRPLHPVKLFGHQLPFTPGVIPKGQKRLAHAVGSVVGTTLVTEEDMRQTLLSDGVKESIRGGVRRALEQNGETELRAVGLALAGETSYDAASDVMQDKLTDMLTDRVSGMHLGETISAQAIEAVKQKLAGSLFGRMLSDDMLSGFAEPISEGIDRYLQGNAYALIRPEVANGWEEIERKSLGDVQDILAEASMKIEDVVVAAYEKIVDSEAGALLRMLDLSGIAERKIAAMKPEELEKLVLSVMKKELNAVVRLGALVGFLLGLLNLFF